MAKDFNDISFEDSQKAHAGYSDLTQPNDSQGITPPHLRNLGNLPNDKQPEPILIAPTEQIQLLWAKQYPNIKVVLSQKIPTEPSQKIAKILDELIIRGGKDLFAPTEALRAEALASIEAAIREARIEELRLLAEKIAKYGDGKPVRFQEEAVIQVSKIFLRISDIKALGGNTNNE